MTRSIRLMPSLLLSSLLLLVPFLEAADEKEKGDDKKEKEWTQIFSVSNEPGGFKHFDVTQNCKAKFSWETTPDGQVPQFRVTVAKLNERNGNYQIIGTVVSTNTASKSSSGMLLASGKYRLYIATKFMKYTLRIEGQPVK